MKCQHLRYLYILSPGIKAKVAGPAHCLASYLHNSDIPALETKVSLDFQLWHGSEYRQYKRCSSDMIDSYLLLHFDQDRGCISGKEKKNTFSFTFFSHTFKCCGQTDFPFFVTLLFCLTFVEAKI